MSSPGSATRTVCSLVVPPPTARICSGVAERSPVVTEQVEPVGRILGEVVELLFANFEHIHPDVAGRRGDHRARSVDRGGPGGEQDVKLARFAAEPPVDRVDVTGHPVRGGTETRQDGEATDHGDPTSEPALDLRKRLNQGRRDRTEELYYGRVITRHA
jgi:hypothetical protein